MGSGRRSRHAVRGHALSASPKASILVPTWNGERDLARLLPALERQHFAGGFELRAIDSSSTDGTRGLLERAGATVHAIPQAEFGHGRTRNQLARGARGAFLVFLSQDSEPRDARFLDELLRPFDDAHVVGTFARVLPRPDDDPLTRRTVLAAPEADERERAVDPGAPWFNNVASAIRASWFAAHPFPDVAFGEDLAWARATLAAGGRIVFAARSAVWHAHRYTPRDAFARYRIDAAFHRDLTGQRVRPHLFALAKGVAYELREDWRHLGRERVPGRVGWTLRSVALRTAQVAGQYVGGRRGTGSATESTRVEAAP